MHSNGMKVNQVPFSFHTVKTKRRAAAADAGRRFAKLQTSFECCPYEVAGGGEEKGGKQRRTRRKSFPICPLFLSLRLNHRHHRFSPRHAGHSVPSGSLGDIYSATDGEGKEKASWWRFAHNYMEIPRTVTHTADAISCAGSNPRQSRGTGGV